VSASRGEKDSLVDMHFADFVTCAMDEIVNQAAKIRYMFGGQARTPLVIWVPDGGGLAQPHIILSHWKAGSSMFRD
jgi:pyruvate/2-oxoglutarate/acetoin dehydrogenase E1 component